MRLLPETTPDGRLLLATVGLRTFAFGFLSVILGLFLQERGLTPDLIGMTFTAALAGGAATTIAFTRVADQIGRRRVLIASALLMAAGGATFALARSPLLLIVGALVGTVSPSGKDVGPSLSIEQAILPQTTHDVNRTALFATYNFVSSIAAAIGALASGLPTLLGIAPVDGYETLVWVYVALALVLVALFSRLSPHAETKSDQPSQPRRLGLHQSRGIVIRLAALFALDSFAGGFVVQGLIAYWFHLRYGVAVGALGAIFFGTNLAAALSFFAAAPIARRIGLLRTMVFTHLPSNVLLALVPLVPGLPLAIAALIGRSLLSQLDVPTRQSYTMAVVAPDERSAAAGLTSVARNAAAAAAPVFSAATLAHPTLGIPFLLGGALKIVYDLAILRVFRDVHPPEESAVIRSKSSP